MADASKNTYGYSWARCEYCGRWIGEFEFLRGTAHRVFVTPDSDFTHETYRTYHIQCHAKATTELERICLND